MQVPYLPLKRVNALFGPELPEAMARVLESGQFVRGREVERFEGEFAKFCGAGFCVGVGNGLEALSVLLKSYVELGRIRPGTEVVVPSNTFIATWLAVKLAGLVPVPAEPELETSLVSAETVLKAVTERTAAVLAVHLYGRVAPMDDLKASLAGSGILLLEDAAQAHGALLAGRRAGALGHAAGFSFYPGKNLGALGDAGAIVTSDGDLASMARKVANYGSAEKYVHEVAGENSRLDELQAALLAVKLKRLDEHNRLRARIASRYLAEIKNPLLRLPCPGAEGEHVWHIFAVHSKFRDALRRHFAAAGIETLIHYPRPPHLQPAFAGFAQLRLPRAERLASETLSLPLHQAMTEAEVEAVIRAANSFEAP